MDTNVEVVPTAWSLNMGHLQLVDSEDRRHVAPFRAVSYVVVDDHAKSVTFGLNDGSRLTAAFGIGPSEEYSDFRLQLTIALPSDSGYPNKLDV